MAPEAQWLVGLYLLTTLFIGLRAGKRAKKSLSDYLVAGRRLTMPAFVASLVSTWYGGILGVGEFTWRYGVSNWLVFGVPYYLFAVIFALFLAKKARRSEHFTIPDQLEAAYGKRTAVAGAGFLFLLTLPAPYLLMIGVLLALFFPIPLSLAVVFAAIFSFVYIYRDGLNAVVRTDVLQFALMFAGFLLVVGYAVFQHGGYGFLVENLPESHLTWHGGNSVQYILVWYFIAASTLVDPNFYQRCFAAKTENVARRGILISVVLWFLFDFLTTTTGLYARVLLPDLANPVEAFPGLAEVVLPPLAHGFFLVALLATIMSTLDSFSFVSAVTLGRDILGKMKFGRAFLEYKKRLTPSSPHALSFPRRRESRDRAHTMDSRLRGNDGSDGVAKDLDQRRIIVGLAVSLTLSIILALTVDSVIDLWYQFGSVATPALLVPLASSFSRRWRLRRKTAFWSILFSGLTALIWLIAGLLTVTPFGNIEPIFPGLAVSILIFIFDLSRRKSPE